MYGFFNVLVIPQRRQAHLPQSHAGGIVGLRGVRGGQLFCQRAAGKYLRFAKSGQVGPQRRHSVAQSGLGVAFQILLAQAAYRIAERRGLILVKVGCT